MNKARKLSTCPCGILRTRLRREMTSAANHHHLERGDLRRFASRSDRDDLEAELGQLAERRSSRRFSSRPFYTNIEDKYRSCTRRRRGAPLPRVAPAAASSSFGQVPAGTGCTVGVPATRPSVVLLPPPPIMIWDAAWSRLRRVTAGPAGSGAARVGLSCRATSAGNLQCLPSSRLEPLGEPRVNGCQASCLLLFPVRADADPGPADGSTSSLVTILARTPGVAV